MTLFLQLVLNGLVAGALYSLVAISFALVFGATRHFHIAHAAVFAAAGYLAYALVDRAGLPRGLAAGLGVAAACVFGVVIVLGIYVPLERRGGTGFVLFLVSLGVLILVENTFTLWLGSSTVSVFPGTRLVQPVYLGSVSLTEMQVILIGAACVAFLALLVLLARTGLGKDIRALASNAELVRVLGRRPEGIQIAVYAIASAVVGLAGVYQVFDTGIRPGIGSTFTIVAFVAVILGGIGSVAGAFTAAVLLGLLENVSQLWIPSQWSEAIVFLAFLLIITVSPSGLAGLPKPRIPRLRVQEAPAKP